MLQEWHLVNKITTNDPVEQWSWWCNATFPIYGWNATDAGGLTSCVRGYWLNNTLHTHVQAMMNGKMDAIYKERYNKEKWLAGNLANATAIEWKKMEQKRIEDKKKKFDDFIKQDGTIFGIFNTTNSTK